MEELRALIALSRLKGLGMARKRRLLEEIPLIAPLFERRVPSGDPVLAREIASFEGWKAIDEELAQLGDMGAEALTIRDDLYPAALKAIPDPPLVLYKKGPLKTNGPALAIVGSRRATEEGKNLAEKIADTLSSVGITIVSGLARGIDGAAHRGALAGKGKTLAILGCGLDIVYPSEHDRLLRKIGEEGAVFTEYGLGERPMAGHFPERNRIIAGLARGVLVIEATEKSGSLITARLGIEYGKSVMAVPGSIFSDGSKGTNALIKQGARLVDTIEDIISECFPEIRIGNKLPIDMNEREGYIYSIVGHGKIHVDEVIEKSNMGAKEVMAILTMLEMKEAVREVAGGFYIKK